MKKKNNDKNEEKTIDLRNASDEEVLKAFQQMSPDDKLIVVESDQYETKKDLRSDREVVLTAVKNDCDTTGSALEYASENLRSDREVVLEVNMNRLTELVIDTNELYTLFK